MIRSPIGLRLENVPGSVLPDRIRQAAQLGAKGVLLDATGEVAPERLTDTGRRALRHLVRTMELKLTALALPTRRPFDTYDQLEDRLARADRAFALAYELQTNLVVCRVGGVPPESDPERREIFRGALLELAKRADHRGVRLAVETGPDAGATLRAFLDSLAHPALAASIDPGALLSLGHDPVAATRDLGPWVVHAYATDSTGPGSRALLTMTRGFAATRSGLDWEEYLGSLEEIEYRGTMTIWPDPAGDMASQFRAVKERLDRF